MTEKETPPAGVGAPVEGLESSFDASEHNLAADLAQAPAPRIVAHDYRDFVSMDFPPRGMLLAPILPEKGLAMLYAPRGVGKTHLALGMAFAISTGTSFLRFRAPAPRRVLYLDGEMPAISLRDRLKGVEKAVGISPGPGNLVICAADFQEIGLPDLATLEGQEEMWPLVRQADLIFLDNLSTLARSVRENEADDWLRVQDWLLRLRRQGKSVLLVHHAGKGGQQRGTSRREDVLDTVIALKRPIDYTPADGARVELHFEKSRGFFGADAEPLEARLEERDGAHGWHWQGLENAKLQMATRLFGEGCTVREVAEQLGISKSAAGRLRKDAENLEWLS